MSQVKKAVIPVAGLGTRMLPATKAIPKEMLPVVDKPLIQYVVSECVAAGLKEIILVTHASKNSIENHFDTSFELEATLEKRVKRQLLEEVQQQQHQNKLLGIKGRPTKKVRRDLDKLNDQVKSLFILDKIINELNTTNSGK